jgi:ferredoxin
VSTLEERARALLESRKAPDARKAAAGFVSQASRDVAFQIEACVRCGQCAEACHFYLVTRDPRYTPIYKLLLFVWLPFGKLAHAFVVFISRGITGAALARKGAAI